MIYYILPMLFPFAASIVCLAKNYSLSESASLIASVLSITASLYVLFLKPSYIDFLYIDGFSKIMLVIISAIYLTTVLFSSAYLKHIKNPIISKSSYFLFLNLFVFSMLFSVSLNNLGLMWVGIEATTITSALLVAIDNDKASLESSWRYIIIVSTGLVISLVGIMLIYASMHTLKITELLINKPSHPKLLVMGAVLAIIGFSTKAGIFPMHTWLPDVHGHAIAPVSAIFSSILLPTALFGVYRIIETASFDNVRIFALLLGVLTVVFASIFLISQKFYKRMFAYSSMENMGMILIGLAIDNKFAFLGAVILLVSHAFAKSSAFYTTGNILSIYKTRDINNVKGVVKTLPFGAYSFLLSAMAVTGAPPFGTFLGELFIIYALYLKFGIVSAIAVLIFLSISFFSLNHKVAKICFSITPEKQVQKKDEVISSLIPIINTVLAFLVIFFVGFINNILTSGMLK